MAYRLFKTSDIQEVILKSNKLAKMPRDSRLLAKLDKGVKGILGGQLADHCQIGKIEAGTLVYYVDSPIWAHTFRMSKLSILSTLHSLSAAHLDDKDGETESRHFNRADYKQLSEIQDIQIRVRPSIARPEKFKKAPRPPLPKLSASTTKSIEETAQTLIDPEIAELWAAFARKHSKPSQN